MVVAGKGYRLDAPVGWVRIRGQADLALRHPDSGAGLLAHATCGPRVGRRSLAVLARHLRFGLHGVRGLSEAPAVVAGAPALRLALEARLDGRPVAIRAVVVRAGHCVYDLALVAAPEALAAVEPAFERFVESFTWTTTP